MGKMVWISYNSMKQRKGLKDWLQTKMEQRERENERLRIENKKENVVDSEKNIGTSSESEMKMPELRIMEQSKNEKLKILRAEREAQRVRDQIEADQILRDQIEAEKAKQEQRGSIEAEKIKQKVKNLNNKDRTKQIERNKKERERQDAKARKLRKKKIKQKKQRRYKVNPGDLTEYETDSESEDEYHHDSDPEDPEEQDQDIQVLLSRFHKLAAMGQLFFRHGGHRTRCKPQDRVIKVSFDHNGNAKEISWGSGSRHIAFKDILYISWGHFSPVFEVRKDYLSPKKCLSVVGRNGHILDLEGYTEHVTELWVKGLRKLKGQSNDKSDKMAQKNFVNLLEQTKKQTDQRKINDIMRLQQDLFIMSTHSVFRHLEEERIWDIDQDIMEMFSPQKMYPIALKADIPWRRWQHWIRERVTAYLRDNGRVYNNNNNNNITVQPVLNNNNNNNNARIIHF